MRPLIYLTYLKKRALSMISNILKAILDTSNNQKEKSQEIESRLRVAEENIRALTEVNEVLAQTLARNTATFLEVVESNSYIIDQIEQIHDIFITAGIISPVSKLGYLARINKQVDDDGSYN